MKSSGSKETDPPAGALKCPKGYFCDQYWIGPNQGITSFDNVHLFALCYLFINYAFVCYFDLKHVILFNNTKHGAIVRSNGQH